ncbi:MAG: cohesin domain-containing protein, partial [Eubacteriales bacterium]|nr:cohesin domain-containing protein [Eubacteriales bacterium]
MKKKIASMLAFIILISIFFLPQLVLANNGAVTVYASAQTVSVGQTVTISVGVSPSIKMGSFNCTLAYDADVFNYSSGSSGIGAGITASAGVINIAKNAGDSFTAGTVATLTFAAKNSGSINFTVSEGYGSSLYDDYTFSGGAFASVKVENAPPPTPAPTTTTTTPKQTPLVPVETIPPSTSTTTTTEATTTETTKPFKAVDHAGRSLAIAEYDLESLEIPSG